jgi:hypothetical protein
MQTLEAYKQGGMFSAFAKVVRTEGLFALYKGIIPPLLGSSIFRSLQFGIFNTTYTLLKDEPVARFDPIVLNNCHTSCSNGFGCE